MSIDLNWETVTGGPDGQALSNSIRDFIHAKFQSVPLPRFIKSVTVHDFEFGSIPPELELKDINDPLPDFYESNSDLESSSCSSSSAGDDDDKEVSASAALPPRPPLNPAAPGKHPPLPHLQTPLARHLLPELASPFLGVSTPGIPGGPSQHLHYFASQFATGLSGTQTPLAAVAGAHNLAHRHSSDLYGGSAHSRQTSQGSSSARSANGLHVKEKHSVSTLAPTTAGTSRPPTRDRKSGMGFKTEAASSSNSAFEPPPPPRRKQPGPSDLQAVFRIRYAGDVRLLLTAHILLDYPMPSFVGIPVRLSITGLTFDGVGVIAYIRKRVHFCFLSPEDAVTAVGADGEGGRMGRLLQEIRVESEIGERQGGRQSLKNVGKVERFVLEQVRRIFEEELVYPSFWTFLV